MSSGALTAQKRLQPSLEVEMVPLLLAQQVFRTCVWLLKVSTAQKVTVWPGRALGISYLLGKQVVDGLSVEVVADILRGVRGTVGLV